jgi:hypothetical protein
LDVGDGEHSRVEPVLKASAAAMQCRSEFRLVVDRRRRRLN